MSLITDSLPTFKEFVVHLLIIPEIIMTILGQTSNFVGKYSLKGSEYLKNLRKELLDDQKSDSSRTEECHDVAATEEASEVPRPRIKAASVDETTAA